MNYNNEIHRRSVRIKGYDYSQYGAYFVTLVTDQCLSMFGSIHSTNIVLSEIGQAVSRSWSEIPDHFPHITLDEFVLMPNHLHGIIRLNPTEQTVGARHAVPLPPKTENLAVEARHAVPLQSASESFGRPVPGSLSTIIRSFKSATTKLIRLHLENPNFILWQRNYWEHVVRNDDEMNQIRTYIRFNPAQWESDRDNPNGIIKESKEPYFAL